MAVRLTVSSGSENVLVLSFSEDVNFLVYFRIKNLLAIVYCNKRCVYLIGIVNYVLLIKTLLCRSRSPRKRRRRSPTPRPTKIHIGRLTRTVNKDHIMEIFGTYGIIKNVEFPKDHIHHHLGRLYCYVEYATADEAENAMKHMDGGQIDGQEITAAPVLIPKPRPLPPRR